MERDVLGEIQEYERELALPKDFFLSLVGEDDWSFVIKLNALIEAACTDSLVALLHAPQLREALAALDLAHQKYGKITMLRQLGSLTSEQCAVLQELYQLRNKLAHNIQQVGFSFTAHVEGLDTNQRKNFIARAGHSLQDTLVFKGKTYTQAEFVVQAPKFSVWLTVSEILACLRVDKQKAEVALLKVALEATRPADQTR